MTTPIKNHQFSVTIATVAAVLLFVSSTAYKVGQEKMGLNDKLCNVSDLIIASNNSLVDHIDSDDTKWKDQESINSKLNESIDSIEHNSGVMRNDIDWIKKKLGG